MFSLFGSWQLVYLAVGSSSLICPREFVATSIASNARDTPKSTNTGFYYYYGNINMYL